MRLLRSPTRLAIVLLAITSLSGCCVLPFGDGHGGRGRGPGWSGPYGGGHHR